MTSKSPGKPFAGTELTRFLEKRILQLKPKKSQREIAAQAGFTSVNVLSMIKAGSLKLPLDRVPSLATALECDPRLLFRLALEQDGNDTVAAATREIFGTVVSRNEVAWIEAIREASDHTDPSLTVRARSALRAIFGK
jgi:hypothetical protein